MRKDSRRWPSTPRPTAPRRTSGPPIARWRSARPPPAESYLRIDRLVAGRAGQRCGRDAPGLRVSRRARRRSPRRSSGRTSCSSARPPPPSAPWATRRRRAGACATRACRWCPAPSEPITELGAAQALATELGYPVLVKAAAGGGGRGMRVVRAPAELGPALETAASEARKAFGDAERLPREVHPAAAPRGDPGARRPGAHRAPGRARVLDPAPASEAGGGGPIARGYDRAPRVDGRGGGRGGAGGGLSAAREPASFCWRADRSFYFLEMNTRIQVEHPVTELVYGVDLVREQLRIAAGERMRVPDRLAGAARLVDGVPDHQRGSGERVPAVHRPNRASARAWRAGRALGRRRRDR